MNPNSQICLVTAYSIPFSYVDYYTKRNVVNMLYDIRMFFNGLKRHYRDIERSVDRKSVSHPVPMWPVGNLRINHKSKGSIFVRYHFDLFTGPRSYKVKSLSWDKLIINCNSNLNFRTFGEL